MEIHDPKRRQAPRFGGQWGVWPAGAVSYRVHLDCRATCMVPKWSGPIRLSRIYEFTIYCKYTWYYHAQHA